MKMNWRLVTTCLLLVLITVVYIIEGAYAFAAFNVAVGIGAAVWIRKALRKAGDQ